MEEKVEEQEVARFYTRSRRFPKMVGRMHDGTRIPGGPYTLTQAGVGGAILLIALMTRSKWGTGNIIFDLPLVVALAWGGAWLAGRIPSTRRNLLSVLAGAIGAVRRPVTGKYRGVTVQLRKPHTVRGRVSIDSASTSGYAHSTSPAVELATTPQPAAATIPAEDQPRAVAVSGRPEKQQQRPTPAVSGVERLLELARTK